MSILPQDQKTRDLAFLFIVLAPLLIGCLTLYLGQDANWDFRNYHWYNAYAWLGDRYDIDILPAQKPVFYNPLIDVPFFLLAQATSAKVAFFILGTLQGLNIILLFLIAQTVIIIPKQSHKLCVCASLSLIGMLGGGGIGLIGTSFYDNVTSLGFFASILMTFVYWEKLKHTSTHTAIFISLLIGIPAGIATGLKLVAIGFAVGLCVAFLFIAKSISRRITLAVSCGIGIMIGITITLGPWAFHLWETYKNPLFPHLNQIFQSPLAPFVASLDTKFLPDDISEAIRFPFIFALNPLQVSEIVWQDFRIPLLYALTPVVLLLRLFVKKNNVTPNHFSQIDKTRFLFWFSATSYVIWLWLFSIYRYLIPLEMLSPLLIILVIGVLPISSKKRVLLCCISLIFVVSTIQIGNWGRHKTWLDSPAPVTIPALNDTKNLIILMTTHEPYAHVVPSFPPEITFVRVQSNFTSPEQKNGFNKLILDKISTHKGPFKALIPEWSLDWTQQTFNHFNLQALPKSCVPVKDHLYNSQLILCDVKRL